jgi:hypothetical protein
LSFADGHVEWWKWRDGALKFYNDFWHPTPPGDRDLLRRQQALPQPWVSKSLRTGLKIVGADVRRL